MPERERPQEHEKRMDELNGECRILSEKQGTSLLFKIKL